MALKLMFLPHKASSSILPELGSVSCGMVGRYTCYKSIEKKEVKVTVKTKGRDVSKY